MADIKQADHLPFIFAFLVVGTWIGAAFSFKSLGGIYFIIKLYAATECNFVDFIVY